MLMEMNFLNISWKSKDAKGMLGVMLMKRKGGILGRIFVLQ